MREAGIRIAAIVMALAGLCGWGIADEPDPRARGFSVAPGFEPGLPVDFVAEKIEYAGDSLIGTEQVRIQQGRQILSARYVQYNPKTGAAYARDNVIFVRGNGTIWKGKELSFNFKTGMGDFGTFEIDRDPYRVFGRDSSMPAPNVVQVQNVTITTCKGDEPWEFEVRMKEATLTDQRYLHARNAVVYLGRVPIMWWPVYNRDLEGSGKWDIVPGYTSRLGAFLQVYYNYSMIESRLLKGRTGATYFSERGLGLEHTFFWYNSNLVWNGQATGFMIQDQQLYRNEQEEQERSDTLTDSQRYRVRAQHTQTIDDQNWFATDFTLMSDPYVNKDFFRRDYRLSPVPENRATYVNHGDVYSFSLQLNSRLNDFFSNVNRLPEARLTITPVELGGSGLYYQSDSSATFLQRAYKSTSDSEDYDAFRADSYQLLSYPGRYFGFLGFTPRAGYRGTYYSKTHRVAETVTNVVEYVGADGLPATSNQVSTVMAESGSEIRQLPEVGFDTSFRAFKVFDQGENIWGNSLRHVAEPYAKYTWTPEPDLRPDRIYQFDEIDEIDRDHSVRFGLKNKIQTRRKTGSYVEYTSYRSTRDLESTFDMMDGSSLKELPSTGSWVPQDVLRTDIYTKYRLEKYPEEEDFGPIGFDLEMRAASNLRLRTRGSYDLYESQLQQVESQLSWRSGNNTTLTLDHIYRPESRNTLAGILDLYPRARWALRIYERYDFESGRLEEHSYLLRRRMDCVGWGLGLSIEPGYDDQETDYRVWFQIWLLDLPGAEIQIGG